VVTELPAFIDWPETGLWEMTDETCGRGVAHPNIIAVLDLHGPLSLNSQPCSKCLGKLDHKNCLKTGVHSIKDTLN